MHLFKISVNVPEEFAEELMDAVTEAIDAPYDNYERVFTTSKVTGTWRPVNKARPFKGSIDVIEIAEELKIEFIVQKKDLASAIRAVIDVHPYEEPAIDVIEMKDWHSII